ncbi:DUF445 domain-containing protein [Sulfuricurvum sp.]|uniref:DUF445 domain-containing protein n=1 Tax=Sulfuricurvum sp. TaxID=2025608 RepID=UPI003562757A
MKLIALSVLALAFIGYLIGMHFHVEALKAFSEAAMVGGLADWFAVVALFRRPMGLPIPHTALIPNNKDSIGENLGQFVAGEFLTRERLEPKINEFDFAEKASHWLAERSNALKVSNLIVKDIIPGILNVVNDDDVKRFIHAQFINKLESINFGKWLGTGLDTLTKDGRHQELFTTILEKVHIEFHNYANRIHTRVSEKTPWWSLGVADETIANGIINGIDAFLRDAKRPSSDVRKKVNHYIVEMVEKLKSSPEMQDNINDFIYKLSHNHEVNEYINGIWNEIKTWVLNDLSRKEESKIKNALTDMFQNLGSGLNQDEPLKNKINGFIKTTVIDKLIEYKGVISHFIASTVKSWDSKEVAEKLELEIGKDLQFIRINGAVVGGIAGLMIYLISQFVF